MDLDFLTDGLKTLDTQRKLAEAFEGFTIADFERFLREFHFENFMGVEASNELYYEVAREFHYWLRAFKTFTSPYKESYFTTETLDHLTGEIFDEECPKIAMGLDGYLIDVRKGQMVMIAGRTFGAIYDWCSFLADDYDFKALMKNWRK